VREPKKSKEEQKHDANTKHEEYKQKLMQKRANQKKKIASMDTDNIDSKTNKK